MKAGVKMVSGAISIHDSALSEDAMRECTGLGALGSGLRSRGATGFLFGASWVDTHGSCWLSFIDSDDMKADSPKCCWRL